TVVSTHADGEFLDRRNHDHAFGFVQHGLGNVVRNVENLHQHFSGMAKAVLFVLLGLDHGGADQRGKRERKEFFHHISLRVSSVPTHLTTTSTLGAIREKS